LKEGGGADEELPTEEEEDGGEQLESKPNRVTFASDRESSKPDREHICFVVSMRVSIDGESSFGVFASSKREEAEES
jgi:hypothetical protein